MSSDFESDPAVDYTFRSYKGELAPETLDRITKYLLNEGLVLQPGLSEMVDEDAAHLRDTLPTSGHSFIGKEHFWGFGAEIGMIRRSSGRLFNRLAYPLQVDSQTSRKQVLPPSALGLTVLSRAEANLPWPPDPYALDTSVSDFRHRSHAKSPAGNHLSDKDVAIQVKGIVDLPNEPDKLRLSAEMYGADLKLLQMFAVHLEDIIQI